VSLRLDALNVARVSTRAYVGPHCTHQDRNRRRSEVNDALNYNSVARMRPVPADSHLLKVRRMGRDYRFGDFGLYLGLHEGRYTVALQSVLVADIIGCRPCFTTIIIATYGRTPRARIKMVRVVAIAAIVPSKAPGLCPRRHQRPRPRRNLLSSFGDTPVWPRPCVSFPSRGVVSRSCSGFLPSASPYFRQCQGLR
jgi:hypothetical protein